MLELVLPKYWSWGVEHCSMNVLCQTECNPVSLYAQEFDLEQKIDLEIKMREGTTKLLAACRHQTQTLEAAKSLLTSNERMSAYMAELQRRKRDLPPRPLGWVCCVQLYNTNQCKSTRLYMSKSKYQYGNCISQEFDGCIFTLHATLQVVSETKKWTKRTVIYSVFFMTSLFYIYKLIKHSHYTHLEFLLVLLPYSCPWKVNLKG